MSRPKETARIRATSFADSGVRENKSPTVGGLRVSGTFFFFFFFGRDAPYVFACTVLGILGRGRGGGIDEECELVASWNSFVAVTGIS